MTQPLGCGSHVEGDRASRSGIPEIVVTSNPYEDLDPLRPDLRPEGVVARALGMVWFPEYLAGHADEASAAFQWFWGTDKGTRFPIAFLQMLSLLSAIQFVGPHLSRRRRCGEALAKIFSQGVAAGGYYEQVRTVEVKVRQRRGDQPRGVLRWRGTTRSDRQTGSSSLGGTGVGQVRLPQRALLHLRTPAHGEAEVIRRGRVVGAVRRSSTVGAEAAAI